MRFAFPLRIIHYIIKIDKFILSAFLEVLFLRNILGYIALIAVV